MRVLQLYYVELWVLDLVSLMVVGWFVLAVIDHKNEADSVTPQAVCIGQGHSPYISA